MVQRIVGIGEMLVSDSQEDELVTIGLGSCVAVIVSHASTRIAGLAHIVLPSRMEQHANSQSLPRAYYADTGIPGLLSELRTYAAIHPRTCETHIVGGACLGARQGFQVGQRNVQAVQTLLRRHHFRVCGQAVGGHVPRTVSVEVHSGRVRVTEPNGFERELTGR